MIDEYLSGMSFILSVFPIYWHFAHSSMADIVSAYMGQIEGIEKGRSEAW